MLGREVRFGVQVRIENPEAVRLFRWGIFLLMVLGFVCLSLFAWFQFEATYFQASLSQAFDHQRERRAEAPHQNGARDRRSTALAREHDARSAAATGQESNALAKEVLGRLEIPSVGLKVMVLRGTGGSTLRKGAGWLPDSAEPGGSGNVAIAAHRDTHFRPLREIHQGDLVELTTLDGRYDYRVDWTAIVDPEDTEVLEPTSKSALTLITCYPFYYVGHAPRRFVVRAIQSGG